jgi:5'-nucleotidase
MNGLFQNRINEFSKYDKNKNQSMKPLILVTNDDGVQSPGLRAAAEALNKLGEILVVAPKTQQTGMGRAFPKHEGLGIIEMLKDRIEEKVHPYYAVHGSPAQAVAHGVLEIAPKRPALCISGINYGENLGGTNLISGTVGAALEAACYGIPALAISIGAKSSEQYLKPYCRQDWEVVIYFVRKFASLVLSHGLPPNVSLLNINIPSEATQETEVRTTCQSRQNYYMCAEPEKRDFSVNFRLPVKVDIDYDTLEPDSDIYAFVVDGVVSVTPIGTDLTVRDILSAPVRITAAIDRKGDR